MDFSSWRFCFMSLLCWTTGRTWLKNDLMSCMVWWSMFIGKSIKLWQRCQQGWGLKLVMNDLGPSNVITTINFLHWIYMPGHNMSLLQSIQRLLFTLQRFVNQGISKCIVCGYVSRLSQLLWGLASYHCPIRIRLLHLDMFNISSWATCELCVFFRLCIDSIL